MRSCSKCGAPLPLQTGRGRRRSMCASCSPSRPKKKPAVTAAPAASAHDVSGGVVATVTAELSAAGMLDTHKGQAALLLARRMESGDDTGAALAQMVRQLRETMASALASAEPDEVDPVDELRAKRERRHA